MVNTEYFYPEIKLIINNQCFTKGITVSVTSSKELVFDFATISFTREIADKINVKNNDNGEIWFGYSGKLEKIFVGTVVATLGESSGKTSITLKDDMVKLETVTINDTFMNVVPQDLIEHVLRSAGVTRYEVDKTNMEVKRQFPVMRLSGINVLRLINQTWNLNHSYYFQDGCFYWGIEKKQDTIPVFNYGKNILSLEKESHAWILTSASFPFIKHSMKIQVNHPNVKGEKTIHQIKFNVNDKGFVRSKLYFK